MLTFEDFVTYNLDHLSPPNTNLKKDFMQHFEIKILNYNLTI